MNNKLNNKLPYPWLAAPWQRVTEMRARLPHALLLHGRQGIGKFAFARALAEALLCETPETGGFACGRCSSCGWMSQGNHPDYRQIEPEDQAEADAETEAPAKGKRKSRYIVVDQIRGLGDLTSLSTHRHGLRVILLHPAEALNANAANALLKMLEEPPPETLFLLVSHQAQRLLPTIRSRCHKLPLPMPDRASAEAWLMGQGVVSTSFCLAQAGGAPLAAIEADDAAFRTELDRFADQLMQASRLDPFQAAGQWSRNDFGAAVGALQKWCYDLLAVRLAGKARYFPERQSSLQAMVKSVDLRLLLEFQRNLTEARALVSHALNSELQLEALLVRYAQMFPTPRT